MSELTELTDQLTEQLQLLQIGLDAQQEEQKRKDDIANFMIPGFKKQIYVGLFLGAKCKSLAKTAATNYSKLKSSYQDVTEVFEAINRSDNGYQIEIKYRITKHECHTIIISLRKCPIINFNDIFKMTCTCSYRGKHHCYHVAESMCHLIDRSTTKSRLIIRDPLDFVKDHESITIKDYSITRSDLNMRKQEWSKFNMETKFFASVNITRKYLTNGKKLSNSMTYLLLFSIRLINPTAPICENCDKKCEWNNGKQDKFSWKHKCHDKKAPEFKSALHTNKFLKEMK